MYVGMPAVHSWSRVISHQASPSSAFAEAITDAVKHAQAARLRITGGISSDHTELTLVVGDDGIGGADASLGTGLTGLADRIEASGGKLAVFSAPGNGTRVVARIPLDGPVDA